MSSAAPRRFPERTGDGVISAAAASRSHGLSEGIPFRPGEGKRSPDGTALFGSGVREGGWNGFAVFSSCGSGVFYAGTGFSAPTRIPGIPPMGENGREKRGG